MRNRFDLQLKQLNDDIIEMGNMIERAIEMGVYALIGHDTDKAKQTIDYDMDIDHMERDIEALCMKLLLQQQPVARDLRQISSALKMITDMERIGDQASDIAELSLQLGDVSDIAELSLIQKMANETMMMVVRGTEAYVTKDLEVAHNVIDNDDIVDDLFDQIKAALVIQHDVQDPQMHIIITDMLTGLLISIIGAHLRSLFFQILGNEIVDRFLILHHAYHFFHHYHLSFLSNDRYCHCYCIKTTQKKQCYFMFLLCKLCDDAPLKKASNGVRP